MAFKLFFRSGGDDQIGDLRRQETAQPAHALDLADLIGNPLFELLIELDDFLCSFAQFIQQSSVLDGDDSLGREVLQKPDLFFRERLDFLPIQDERADQFIVFEHRNGEERSDAPQFNCSNDVRIASFDVSLIRS
jgi:hypothetical protein